MVAFTEEGTPYDAKTGEVYVPQKGDLLVVSA